MLLNVPVALDVLREMESLPSMPANSAADRLRIEVANVLALYTRELAVMPMTVSVFFAIEAVVVGWVIE